MTQPVSQLPDYEKPPVSEVVFGIQFNKLKTIKAPHTGILWQKLDMKEYPECKEMPPLSHLIETFDEPPAQSQLITIEEFTHPPLPRLFFINATKNHLIQIQQDRFHQNWRKRTSDEEYPRFVNLYPKFLKSWEQFTSFINELSLGKIVPNQYELTYINHIPRGEGWTNLIDIEKVFPEFRCKTGVDFLPEPENVSWRRVYRLPNNSGRLHVSLRLGISRELQERTMVLDLTARGFSPDKMKTWFDTAHEWIVRGFTDLTGQSIQQSVWGRKQ